MSGWSLLEFALGLHTTRIGLGRYTNWGIEVIFAVMLYRLMQQRLHSLQRYWLPVWEAMLYGLLASLTAALGFYVFLSLYKFYLNPSWLDLQLEWKVAQLRAAGTDEAVIREKLALLRQAYSPVGLALFVPVYALGGAAFSACVSLWLNWRHQELPKPD
ncbi:MAG: hypothetical protein ACREB3_12885 [Burkholderiales bacterium]